MDPMKQDVGCLRERRKLSIKSFKWEKQML